MFSFELLHGFLIRGILIFSFRQILVTLLNPILNGGGYLNCHLLLKISNIGMQGGAEWYQNSSWDIWSRAKQFSGPITFLGPTLGPTKLALGSKGL